MSDSLETFRRGMGARRRADRRFKSYGLAALIFAGIFLGWFFVDLIWKGSSALRQTYVLAEVTYDEESAGKFGGANAIDAELKKVISRGETRVIPQYVKHNPEVMDTSEEKWLLAKADVDQYVKGKPSPMLEDDARALADRLREEGRMKLKFNTGFFTKGDSKLPEMSGIKIAVLGSIWTLLITMAVSVPIGVLTSIYLEEFAPDNRFTRFVDVNINNLAAIPSIMFGLLGLAIFINFFGVPRSSSLVGGITLGVMMLPIIIIATRAALRAVPDSIREGGYGVGASPWQVVQHHVLPLSIPGILTGSIISLAQAMGETAPLLIVGLMAYVSTTPDTILDGTTVLPAQIYTWASDSPRAYVERTALAILVLLAVLISLNAFAVWLRRKTERRW